MISLSDVDDFKFFLPLMKFSARLVFKTVSKLILGKEMNIIIISEIFCSTDKMPLQHSV